MSDDEEKKKFGVYDILTDISEHKKNHSDHPEFEAVYVPFFINRGLSLHRDTIMHANEMNMNHHLSKRQQHDYLFYSVAKGRRRGSWPKKRAEDELLELVKQYFGYNQTKAKAVLPLLDDETRILLKELFIQGGPVK